METLVTSTVLDLFFVHLLTRNMTRFQKRATLVAITL